MAKKYIFVDGVMTLNPEWVKDNPPVAKVVAPPVPSAPPLAVVTSLEDIQTAQEVQQASGVKMATSESTQDAISTIQEEEFLKKFNSPEEVDGADILEKISAIFAAYEIPFGLLKKLLVLKDYNMNFIMDDSGSMKGTTDTLVGQAGSGKMKEYFRSHSTDPNKPMSRWEEAEDRLHILIDMLAYVPTGTITLSFLNRPERIILERNGKTPEEFAMNAHQEIRNEFAQRPEGGTPIYGVLQRNFDPHPTVKTMHYLFTDGVPSDRSPAEIEQMVKTRKYPEFNPLTLIACSDRDEEVAWLAEIEKDADFVTAVDDIKDETTEVQKYQGARFPYPRGVWLMAQLVSAINPFDLDALDDKNPLSKYTLDELFGRKHTVEEYAEYWKNHPNSSLFASRYNDFLTKELHGSQILDPKGATDKINALTSRMRALFT